MITSAFQNFFYNIIQDMLSVFPDVSSQSAFVQAIETASGYISAIHSFLPYITVTLLIILGFDLIFESGYFLFKVIYWIIRRFPTQS